MEKLSTLLLGSLTIATLALSSCKKGSTPAPKKTSTDFWFGSFQNSNGGNGSEGALFRNDGTVRVYDFDGPGNVADTAVTYIGNGTYSMKGDSITFNFTFPNGQVFTAKGSVNTSVTPNTMTLTDTAPNYVPGKINFTLQSGSSLPLN